MRDIIIQHQRILVRDVPGNAHKISWGPEGSALSTQGSPITHPRSGEATDGMVKGVVTEARLPRFLFQLCHSLVMAP